MTEHLLLIAGAAGAGKSTAIASLFGGTAAVPLSDTAVDFGQLELAPGELVRIHGVPAGTRFDFMWSILRRRALGVLVLVRSAPPAGVAEALEAAEEFAALPGRGGLVVGVTSGGAAAEATREALERALAERFPGSAVPVLTLDPADRGQLVTALSVLAANVESRDRLGG